MASGVALAAADLARPPSRQVSARLLTAAIAAYRGTLSRPLARLGVRCRFSTTCSQYADTCVRRFGAGRGSWLSLGRLLRCGPWTPPETDDPPPQVPAAPPAPPSR